MMNTGGVAEWSGLSVVTEIMS